MLNGINCNSNTKVVVTDNTWYFTILNIEHSPNELSNFDGVD
jgi:hypothetical protein